MRTLIVAVALLTCSGCNRQPATYDDAKALIAERCSTCHTVPGVRTAHGRVGPMLRDLGRQQLIAGRLPNTQANLAAWLLEPQRISPGTAMPDTGLSRGQANQIATYLKTLEDD